MYIDTCLGSEGVNSTKDPLVDIIYEIHVPHFLGGSLLNFVATCKNTRHGLSQLLYQEDMGPSQRASWQFFKTEPHVWESCR